MVVIHKEQYIIKSVASMDRQDEEYEIQEENCMGRLTEICHSESLQDEQ